MAAAKYRRGGGGVAAAIEEKAKASKMAKNISSIKKNSKAWRRSIEMTGVAGGISGGGINGDQHGGQNTSWREMKAMKRQ